MDFLMNLLGYDCAPQAELEIVTVEQVQHGINLELFEQVRKYDFFQDSPFAQGLTWVALDSSFPGSKSIYTYRDPEDWYESMVRFHAQRFAKQPGELTKHDIESFGYLRDDYVLLNQEYFYVSTLNSQSMRVEYDWGLLYDKDRHISRYLERQDMIMRYFQKRGKDFLAIDITKSSSIKPIAEFLGLPSFVDCSFPCLNSTDPADSNSSIQIFDQTFMSFLSGN